MTIEQIQAYGITLNKWITLENAFSSIGLAGDNSIQVVPAANQFYFDSKSECCFRRRTAGKLFLEENLLDITDYAEVPINGKNYRIKYSEGGVTDPTIGRYHEVISLDSIVGFYKFVY